MIHSSRLDSWKKVVATAPWLIRQDVTLFNDNVKVPPGNPESRTSNQLRTFFHVAYKNIPTQP